jgi:hypothetical protein
MSARPSGKTLVYLGAGLALAGSGAATAAGLAANSAGGTAPADSFNKASQSVPAAQRNLGTGGQQPQHQPAAQQPQRQHPGQQPEHADRQPADHPETWHAIAQVIADRTDPAPGHGPLPAQDRLTPVGTSGPQSWMPITSARYANAATIVHQAIAKKMGLRSAVVAVATAMQESTLQNINYGTYDSLGLFQQRPSAGWGSPSQILHPRYAADAFLNALRAYQVNNPGWVHQPLWQLAQDVQNSAFPYAYAKWEAQAAQLVGLVARRMI